MSLTRIPFTVPSEYDELTLHGLIIRPEGRIEGIVQIVHGMCDHKERYIDFMEYLSEHGYLTVIHDMRGHGESVKEPGDLGYFYGGGADAAIRDVESVRAYVEEGVHEELPYILIGNSLGSLVVRGYIQHRDEHIDKLVLLGCPTPRPTLAAQKGSVRMLMKMKGDRAKSKTCDNILNMVLEKPFASEGRAHAWMSTDTDVVDDFNEDPLCNFTYTLNGYDSLIALFDRTYDRKRFKPDHTDLPIFILAGADDPCIGSRKDYGKSVHFIKKLGYTDVKAGLYAGMRHDLLHETKKQKVYRDILDFIEER